ncbi:MAG: PIN domain-containing protein [Candidatus Caldarchaeum sp.]
MYLIDANILLEVLYKREKWQQAASFLERVKKGEETAYILHFTLHGISAILGKPELVSKLIAEVSSWRGLQVIATSLDEELAAAEKAVNMGLDFDDGLQYYAAKKRGLTIISYDEDFDKTDIKKIEPNMHLP